MPEQFFHDGVEYTLPTPSGLTFQSVAAAYQLCIRDERPIYDHGIRIGTEKELVAEFGEMDAPVIHDSDGVYGEAGAEYFQIRGHFMNTLQQAEKKGWSDDERALVEKKLLAFQKPTDHWLLSKPAAGKPWPTYDTTAANGIAALAEQLGLVTEALAYERENKNRKTVLEALVAAQSKPAVEELEAE